ncbi:hypothetical protein AVEN_114012-1 [Araneus ventricosus]|uniref:Uncharacterized protein n=1 Tax=Araneus ventricosus TaxID=182803 RepID=A0A4Y2ST35_ARAVE|nr:hypothetical protein AVEN_114012-1 [Araneus ventricosus]
MQHIWRREGRKYGFIPAKQSTELCPLFIWSELPFSNSDMFIMSTIGSNGEFDVSNPISWDNYAEQLKFFLEANEITNAEKKRGVLLAVCGIKTLGVLRSLLAPASFN